VVAATTGLVFGTQGVGHTVLVTLAGVVTAVPLLLFAAGARRAPLTVIGLLQFVAPILQFITGRGSCTSRCRSNAGSGSRSCGSRWSC
jgi:chloramphenicol-sensitive protein RarD